MGKLVAVQAETNHHNTDGIAWYAYYEGEPDWSLFEDDDLVTAWKAEIEAAAKKDGAPMGFDWDIFEAEGLQDEVPSVLSERAGLRRYYVGQAC
jgi:hypothetical protein